MNRFYRLLLEFQKVNPNIKLSFKNKSLLMKIMGLLLFFVPEFKTKFVTTIGNTICFPSEKELEDKKYLITLCHEFMHVRDGQKLPVLFQLFYLFPLTLAPVALLTLFFLPWPITLVLLIICLSPLPAPGRAYFELRGYTTSLFAINELAKEAGMSEPERKDKLIKAADIYNKQFIGFNYYLMWPFGVRKQLEANTTKILSGKLAEEDDIYKEVAKAIADSK